MNDRTRAIKLLKEARDIVAQRITDQVISGAGELSDPFNSNLDSIIDDGDRLHRLNMILNNLPGVDEDEPRPAATMPGLRRLYDDAPAAASPGVATMGQHALIVGMLSAQPSLRAYHDHVVVGKIFLAADILRMLTGLTAENAERATEIFRARLARNSSYEGMLMSLKAQVRANIAGAISLLNELFGLQQAPAEKVCQNLLVTL